MKIKDAYEKYDVMPTLAEHMRRVGAVAKILTDQITEKDFPAREIVTACLLHDMGNIVKFDLDNVPKGLNIPNIEHWKNIQEKVRSTYGKDEHEVTYKIATEIGVSTVTLDAVLNCGTAKAKSVLDAGNIPAMFVTYCDYHISPTTVVTLEERLADILKRYEHTPKFEGYKNDGDNVRALANYLESRFALDKSLVTFENVMETAKTLDEWELVWLGLNEARE